MNPRWLILLILLIGIGPVVAGRAVTATARSQEECVQPSESGCRVPLAEWVEAALLDPTQAHIWLIQAPATGDLWVEIEDLPANYRLYLYGPTRELAGVSDNEELYGELVEVIDAAPGTYIAIVDSPDGESSDLPYWLYARWDGELPQAGPGEVAPTPAPVATLEPIRNLPTPVRLPPEPTTPPAPAALPTEAPVPAAPTSTIAAVATATPWPTPTTVPTQTVRPTATATPEPPSSCLAPSAFMDPSTVTRPRGGVLHVNFQGSGYQPGSQVQVEREGLPQRFTGTADENCQVRITVQMDPGWTASTYTLYGRGTRYGGDTITLTAALTLR